MLTKHTQLSVHQSSKSVINFMCAIELFAIAIVFSMASSSVSANRTLTIVPFGSRANSLPFHDHDFVTVDRAFNRLNV